MNLNPSQIAFLRFHLGHVTQWRWHFLGCQLRAKNERGRGVTIWRDDLEDMVEAGLVRNGLGCADYVLTEQGREAVK